MLTLPAVNGKTLTMTVTHEAAEMDGEEADIGGDTKGDVETGKQMTASPPKTSTMTRKTPE